MSHIIRHIINLTLAQVDRDLILIINEPADCVGDIVRDPLIFFLLLVFIFLLFFLIIQIVGTL